MTNSRDLILKLKEVREEKGYSLTDIMKLVEDNGDFISKSTLARVFAEGSEDVTFRYEATIKPIANALLDIGTIEDTDNMDTQAMKLLLKYKSDRIQELERQVQELESDLDKQKIKASEKLEKERESFSRSIEFLKEQVTLKDKRMDLLLNAVSEKDKLHKDMLEKLLTCSSCQKEGR